MIARPLALMFWAKIAGTMVAGWSIFGLAARDGAERGPLSASPPCGCRGAAAAETDGPPFARILLVRLRHAATTPHRGERARDENPRRRRAAQAARSLRWRAPMLAIAVRGIGSRFRAPAQTRLARSMEKSR